MAFEHFPSFTKLTSPKVTKIKILRYAFCRYRFPHQLMEVSGWSLKNGGHGAITCIHSGRVTWRNLWPELRWPWADIVRNCAKMMHVKEMRKGGERAGDRFRKRTGEAAKMIPHQVKGWHASRCGGADPPVLKFLGSCRTAADVDSNPSVPYPPSLWRPRLKFKKKFCPESWEKMVLKGHYVLRFLEEKRQKWKPLECIA